MMGRLSGIKKGGFRGVKNPLFWGSKRGFFGVRKGGFLIGRWIEGNSPRVSKNLRAYFKKFVACLRSYCNGFESYQQGMLISS